MGTHLGNEGTVKIGANVVAEVKSWSITESAAIVDDSQMSDAADTHLVGSTNWRGSLTCSWDETDATGQGALTVGASVTLNVYAEGAANGDTYFTGTATVSEIARQGSRNTVIEASFTFTGNGALSQSTVSA